MKALFLLLIFALGSTKAFVVTATTNMQPLLMTGLTVTEFGEEIPHLQTTSRANFFQTVSRTTFGLTVLTTFSTMARPVQARGFATLQQSFERYAPRIRAGGDFYATDLKKMIASGDFSGVKESLQEPPNRSKADLMKPDSGVSARARQSGKFSDARVLVAADLLAAAFSESSVSAKTKKMQTAVSKVREVVQEMEKVSKLALGEEKGFLGIGGKKMDKGEATKKLRDLYVTGGNAWNEYIMAANDDLPLQFDKFAFLK